MNIQDDRMIKVKVIDSFSSHLKKSVTTIRLSDIIYYSSKEKNKCFIRTKARASRSAGGSFNEWFYVELDSSVLDKLFDTIDLTGKNISLQDIA